MAETAVRGIQATLFDYFQDTEYFSIEDAKELVIDQQKRDVNRESIRARIYEGIDKGLFERVGKGLYTVTRKDGQGRENTCLLINGDGRDLSILASDSVDAIITDHPYDTSKSLKGRNRNFADYELFQYTERDFQEKLRVLKSGRFLVEFLPEENGDNYQYLYQVKELARKAGFEYYAKVPWKKGDFVANTGRKSKNTEDIVFFSKGRARNLRIDAQKNKAEPGVEHFMSGTAGMLPTVFDVSGVSKRDKIHQAEKPVELLEQILRFVTKENEMVVDQFAGSGSLGEAALNTHRNSILIEKDPERFEKMAQRMQVLGSIEPVTPAAETLLTLGAEAITTRKEFMESGDRDVIYDFVKKHKMPDPSVLYRGEKDLWEKGHLSEEQKDAVSEAFRAIEDIDLRSADLDVNGQEFLRGLVLERTSALLEANVYFDEQIPVLQAAADAIEAHADGPDAYAAFVRHQNESGLPLKEVSRRLWALPEDQPENVVSALEFAKMVIGHEDYPRVLECSSRGDKRFSPLYARVTIRGKERSIEEWYQDSKRTADGGSAGEGKPFDHIVDPFTKDKLPAKEHADLYRGLWITYLSKNPELVKYAEQFDDFSNVFSGKGVENGYHVMISAYVKGDRERYVGVLKCGKWYKNMERRLSKPVSAPPSLDSQIQNAAHIGATATHETVSSLSDKER